MRKILFPVNLLLFLACVYVVSPKAANYMEIPWHEKMEESEAVEEQTEKNVMEDETKEETGDGAE